MDYKLPADKILEFCDRLEKIIKIGINIVTEYRSAIHYNEKIPSKRKYNYGWQMLQYDSSFSPDEMALIGYNINEIIDEHFKKSDIWPWNRRIFHGFLYVLPEGELGTHIYGETIPDNVEFKLIYVNKNKLCNLMGHVSAALREAFIPLEPLLPWEDIPDFECIPPVDYDQEYSELFEMRLRYLKDIDKLRRAAIRELSLQSDDTKMQQDSPAGDDKKCRTNQDDLIATDQILITVKSVECIFVAKENYKTNVRGSSLCKLFRLVIQYPNRSQSWTGIQKAWNAKSEQDSHDGTNWKIPPSINSLKRYGNRIKKALGELGCYWNQDGSGVQWTPPA
jgi:hypothetical protein